MRFKSASSKGLRVYAVSGINTVSFGIAATAAARKGLLGFAVERIDPVENERYFMPSYKVFKTVIPQPDESTRTRSSDHPIQDFIWSDFTAKPDRKYEYLFYPVKGKPKKLERGDPVSIRIRTEPLFSTSEHDVFFNRGVASSQAYTQRFGNGLIDDLAPAKKQEALDWLSRDLDDALLKFIRQAKSGDTLLGCFYEFRYGPAASEFKQAIKRGVKVRLIVDGKVNRKKDKNGKWLASFPREDNLATLKEAKLGKSTYFLREARTNDIQHNKFMVLLKGKSQRPTQVWTGSTNLSLGGIHGQTNVGHWIRNEDVARQFVAYWQVLKADPGGTKGDDAAEVRAKNAAFRAEIDGLDDTPLTLDDIADGVTTVFSPRNGLKVLDLYVDLVDQAEAHACITLAFGINKTFKDRLSDNRKDGHLVLMLLEKQDKAKKNAKDPFFSLNSKQNIYKAWGSYIDEPAYRWARETNAKLLKLNHHVSYIHSKFLLRDPLGDDPIVVTGSANFSAPSTNANDENMLIIRGEKRVADIYFTEFNRIFFHYYFRAVRQQAAVFGENDYPFQFLEEKPEAWLAHYKPGKLRQKRLEVFLGMKGFS